MNTADFIPIVVEPCTEYAGALRVRRGDRYVDGLGKDETLWVVSGELHRANTTYYNQGFLTADEHAARDAVRKRASNSAAEVVDPSFRSREQELEDALRALTTNPHLDLGDLVYQVREREGLGWEGPAVTAWSQAVEKAKELLK